MAGGVYNKSVVMSSHQYEHIPGVVDITPQKPHNPPKLPRVPARIYKKLLVKKGFMGNRLSEHIDSLPQTKQKWW